MSNCCLNCFNDSELKKLIASQGQLGRCSYCESNQIPICNVSDLSETFEFLTYGLEKDEKGKEAHEVINEAFSLFSSKVKDSRKIFSDISSQEFDHTSYSLKFSTDNYKDSWKNLCSELKHTNRFFLKNEIYKKIFSQKVGDEQSILYSILEQLEHTVLTQDEFYRARIADHALTAAEMGAPPSQLTTAGRANPKGISYVYVADNEDTCVSEVRPYKGSDIYVSTFKSNVERRVIDLTEPRTLFSVIPFSESQYGEVLSIIDLLESFSKELSIPVKPHLSELDYIPTQFLCEYIKSLGPYDGIIFNSSFGKGKNYVFFKQDNFNISEPTCYQLNRIDFHFS